MLAGLFISVLCSAQSATDSLAIIELIKADYLALGKDDTVTIRKHCTADYLLIENGEEVLARIESAAVVKTENKNP